jgi:uncharacterized protein (TIGR00369 family)
LKFEYDPAAKRFRACFRLAKRFSGPPGYAHGGIIAAILDEAMAKLNRIRQVTALTSEIAVRYLRPVPLGVPLEAESHELRVRGRNHFYAAEIRNPEGRVLATGRGKFVAIDPERFRNRSARPSRSGSSKPDKPGRQEAAR